MNVSPGDVLEHVQLNNLRIAARGDGVLSGLAVSQRSTGANMSVDVASGRAYIGDTVYTESGTVNLAIAAAHATLYRKDLISYDPVTSNPIVTQGTNHAGGTSDPVYPPDIPTGDALIAFIDVDPAVTTITDSDIHDARVDVGAGAGKLYTYSLSDTTVKADTSEESTASTSYIKRKDIVAVPSSVVHARFRISFDLKSEVSGSIVASAVLRRNGIAVGTTQTNSAGAYTNHSEDIEGWCGGDTIELWVRISNSAQRAYVRNLYVKGTVKTVTPIETVYSW